MKRIGIFGGTFNPIHLGHLTIAQEVRKRLKLDQVIFVPSFAPPHKVERKLAKAEDRFKMVLLSVKGNAYFRASDWEVKRKITSYSIDTLKHFRNKFGAGTKLFFIIGSDNLKGLRKWKDIKEILKLAKMVVVNRPGHALKGLPKGFLKVAIAGINISSSLIRRRLASHKNADCYLNREVKRYIQKKRLYS